MLLIRYRTIINLKDAKLLLGLPARPVAFRCWLPSTSRYAQHVPMRDPKAFVLCCVPFYVESAGKTVT